MIAIIDYDVGNIQAVANMFRRIGAKCEITSNPVQVGKAERIVLPGNGAFDACMANIRATGLIPVLEQRVLGDEVPLLGICVGAQMLGSGSEEGVEPGLGWIEMTVKRVPVAPGLPVPHMGWSTVMPAALDEHPLLDGLERDSRFYFVHSYYMEPHLKDDILLSSSYGIDFASAIVSKNICGVQFHPEKSHRFGKKLLANFASWNPA